MKNADITPDELYGTLTRYFIDEYPHRPHQGTGMFGATPAQKLDEVIEKYKGIEAPPQDQRRLHLGIRRGATTTSEGVKVFGIPYNSSALQRKTGGKLTRVTAYLDPDDLRCVSITIEGVQEVLEADLSMTAFADLTLQDALDVMRDAAEANPKKRVLHDHHLKEAIKRRAQHSGFFPDSRLPSSYTKIDALQRQADALANVEYVPLSRGGSTTRPEQIMHRDGPAASQQPQGYHEKATSPQNAAVESYVTFEAIKESKL